MATRFDRIPVTKDPALAEALERVRPLLGAGKPTARIVHDLAIAGAEVVVAQQRRRSEQLSWAADASSIADAPWDREVLERIDELAWGAPRLPA